MTRRIFLAGASGAIGRRLIPLLLAAGHEVIGITRSPEKAKLLSSLGIVAGAVLALLVCSAANLLANDRFTFAGARTRRGPATVAAALPFVATLAMLAVLDAAGVASLTAQIATLSVMNLAVGALRFVLLRWSRAS